MGQVRIAGLGTRVEIASLPVLGEFAGTFLYYENTGTATSPVFVLQAGSANPLDGEDVGSRSTPTLGELDGDGDLDLVTGECGGTFAYYENTGSATNPVFVLQAGSANPLDGENVGGLSTPTFGDLDGDGDLDLVTGEGIGTFSYYENTGTATSPVFILQVGVVNPLDGEDAGAFSTPTFGDLDGDGDLDLVTGDIFGAFAYYENTGTATSPIFALQAFLANPLFFENVGYYSTPTFGDLDGDGDLDLMSGENSGTFVYYENTGTATSPIFVLPGAANPLDGEGVGSRSALTLGDLDGDGDLDVVTGEDSGSFNTYYLPEPSQGRLLGAGLAVLKGLERLRRRRRR